MQIDVIQPRNMCIVCIVCMANNITLNTVLSPFVIIFTHRNILNQWYIYERKYQEERNIKKTLLIVIEIERKSWSPEQIGNLEWIGCLPQLVGRFRFIVRAMYKVLWVRFALKNIIVKVHNVYRHIAGVLGKIFGWVFFWRTKLRRRKCALRKSLGGFCCTKCLCELGGVTKMQPFVMMHFAKVALVSGACSVKLMHWGLYCCFRIGWCSVLDAVICTNLYLVLCWTAALMVAFVLGGALWE